MKIALSNELQVRRRDGKWINADPIPDTILVNAGDLLQMWTAGKLLATVSNWKTLRA